MVNLGSGHVESEQQRELVAEPFEQQLVELWGHKHIDLYRS